MERIMELSLSTILIHIVMLTGSGISRHCADIYHRNINLDNNFDLKLRDYEIVFPVLTDTAGNTVPIYYQQHPPISRKIKYLKIKAEKRTFKIELRKSSSIDSTFSVLTKTSGSEFKHRGNDFILSDPCLYEGRAETEWSQAAALSICNGLRGLLRTEDDDYVIQPVEGLMKTQSDKHCFPHILYKKKDIFHTNATFRESSTMRHSSTRDRSFRGWPTTVNIRRKRQGILAPKRKRTIETLVVVDRLMLEKHKSQHQTDVVSYVLTVMNMVNALFHDTTLDTRLNISIMGLLLLEDDEELNLGRIAGDSLNNFCKWQAERSFGLTKRADHAILLTGRDICIDKDGCDTMGLARINGMCIFNETCSISEDTGLGLAFTIAHEIGHNLGMAHDGEGNNCAKNQGYVMSSTINSNNGVFSWSSCSRKALKTFLKRKQSECLLNPVTNHSAFDAKQVQELPGQIYSLRKQCILQFGSNYTVCTSQYVGNKPYICKMLWCESQDGVCKTKHLPASEGSRCGDHMWCRRGECVAFGSDGPQPIHGSWSQFTSWTKCSRTCGIGVKQKQRKCNNPLPQYGGRQCEGNDIIYELCNTFECPSPYVDFWREQCAEFNTKPYRYQYFNWIPPTGNFWRSAASGTCELMCEAEGYGFSVVLASQVKDGTRCRDHANDICIAGKCERVGCDLRLQSNAKEDKCGVCNGNNSTCRFVNGSFTIDVHDSDYYFVTKIPKGATNIFIHEREQLRRSNSYIAIKSVDEDRYYLNGNWELDLNGEKKFAGTVWKYTKKYGIPEILRSNGPTREELTIEALILHRNPGILYSYYEPSKKHDDTIQLRTSMAGLYEWHQFITACTKPCAGGVQRTQLLCRSSNGTDVNEARCSASPKPIPMSFSCNTQPCAPKWLAGNWSSCSVTCGEGLKTRSAMCVQEQVDGSMTISTSLCNLQRQPTQVETCASSSCPRWKTESWSQCSKSCGRGFRTRNVLCVRKDSIIPAYKCNDVKPRQRKGCRLTRCPRVYQWVITAWGKCSVTCGVGIQRRGVRCGRKIGRGSYKPAKKKRCRHLVKPTLSKRKKCIRGQCQPLVASTGNLTISRWIASNWSACTATCGKGMMARSVTCSKFNDRECANDTKPLGTKECRRHCELERQCEDLFAWCGSVIFHSKACGHSFFEKRCCTTCSKLNKINQSHPESDR